MPKRPKLLPPLTTAERYGITEAYQDEWFRRLTEVAKLIDTNHYVLTSDIITRVATAPRVKIVSHIVGGIMTDLGFTRILKREEDQVHTVWVRLDAKRRGLVRFIPDRYPSLDPRDDIFNAEVERKIAERRARERAGLEKPNWETRLRALLATSPKSPIFSSDLYEQICVTDEQKPHVRRPLGKIMREYGWVSDKLYDPHLEVSESQQRVRAGWSKTYRSVAR